MYIKCNFVFFPYGTVGGGKLFDPLLILFAHWQRNYQSIILMVGLFEQGEKNNYKEIQKNILKSYKID